VSIPEVDTVTFPEFVRHKATWLPLLPVGALWETLGLETGSRGIPPPESLWSAHLSKLPKAERPYLLYCPTNAGDHFTNFTHPERNFDVALNDYSGRGEGMDGAEWQFQETGHKWEIAARNLLKIPVAYEFYAFFDNDIEISLLELNLLFDVGESFGFELFQCSLTEDSITAYPHLKNRADSLVRRTNFVEIMMPVFSHEGLIKCVHTFADSESGWGLDVVWPMYVKDMGLVDMIQARHAGQIVSGAWKLRNGLSPHAEMEAVVAKHRRLLKDQGIV
jgi:hypothetical protein